MAKSKVSDAVRRDFEFALQCERELGGMGSVADWPTGEASSVMAFKRYDCEGKKVGCADQGEIVRAIRGKASLNWHIKEWASGIRDELFVVEEFRKAHPWLPEWVWAVVNKATSVRFAVY